MKLFKQLALLIGLAGFFILIDIFLFNVFTSRYVDRRSAEMKGQSIEVSKFVPFDEGSQLVHVSSDYKVEEDIPVLDGAAALLPIFSSVAEALYPRESILFDGSDYASGSSLRYTNTRGSYKALVDGDADIIFCAKPSEGQLSYAKDNGKEFVMVPIGYEAFVFIVGKDNPVSDLSAEEIRGIYTGKYTNWSQLGGEDAPIDAVQRNEGSGSQTSFLGFMGDEKPVKKLYGALFGKAIGFSFRYYVDGINKNPDVKMLSVEGVYPDAENISSGDYPLSSCFYAIYLKDNDNSNIESVIDFCLSEKGQEIIEKSGYIPL